MYDWAELHTPATGLAVRAHYRFQDGHQINEGFFEKRTTDGNQNQHAVCIEYKLELKALYTMYGEQLVCQYYNWK